jgi:undecaprenyl phosphate-alpha-L-ara4N flippase subunit ArnE
MTTFSLLLLGLLSLCVLIETAEQVLYRVAGRRERKSAFWCIAAAISLNMVGLAVWLLVLTQAPLGQALPFLAANNITVAAAGRLIFRERVGLRRWVGILLITAGLVLVVGGGEV